MRDKRACSTGNRKSSRRMVCQSISFSARRRLAVSISASSAADRCSIHSARSATSGPYQAEGSLIGGGNGAMVNRLGIAKEYRMRVRPKKCYRISGAGHALWGGATSRTAISFHGVGATALAAIEKKRHALGEFPIHQGEFAMPDFKSTPEVI